MITSPSSARTNVFPSNFGFTASLNYLDSIGVSNIKSSPSLTVQSGKEIYFSAGQNIPYMTSSASVNGASQSATQNVQYKDVGLSVRLTPNLINDIVFIDLKFIMESLLDKSSLTPSTAKRELDNSFQLKKRQVIVLSGLVQTETSTSTIGIPLLMKLPYIGQI
ncbi:MAG: type II and III secretion system protein, partial [bacterium]|nr:type II and III secretion system protein [bacterium]